MALRSVGVYLLIAATAVVGGAHDRHRDGLYVDRMELEFVNSDLIVREWCQRGDSLMITKDLDLIIQGRKVGLSPSQRRLVGEYYDKIRELEKLAEKIREEGVDIDLEEVERLSQDITSRVRKKVRDPVKPPVPRLELQGDRYLWLDREELDEWLEEFRIEIAIMTEELEGFDDEINEALRDLDIRAISKTAAEAEGLSDELDEIQQRMKQRIPELRELDWFAED